MARPRLDDPRSTVVHFRLNETETTVLDDLVRRGNYPSRTALLRALLHEAAANTPPDPDTDLYDDAV